MEIVLCDKNPKMVFEWNLLLEGLCFDGMFVTIVEDDYINGAQKLRCDVMTSPANSFGLMDGGLDRSIRDYYLTQGIDIQAAVQKRLNMLYAGVQPIGTSMYVHTNDIDLIHTPTMRVPKPIVDLEVIYFATRSTIICAKQKGVDRVIMPGFGGGVGQVRPQFIARVMADAIRSLAIGDFKEWEDVNRLVGREYLGLR